MQRVPTKIDYRRRKRVSDPVAGLAYQFNEAPRNTEFPEHALVINLPRSTERLAKFKASNNFTGTTEVLEAVDGTLHTPKVPSMKFGDVGCLLSHKKALEHARDSGWSMALIFEDDVIFPPDFNERLRQCMSELPADWELFWGGGKDNTPSIPYSPNLKRLTGSWGTFMYVIRNTVYQKFIEIFSEEFQSSDEYYRREHQSLQSYRASTDLVQHIWGASDRIVINQAK